ncbi:Leukocyte elastase inhibitor [Bagarius yarrelli]|uniref:Leukocyte elastase inhibitor n=1 Tax=Bagarius yarrelli TaxID=175774 RepID=A0A556VXH6_BAGYA|nr:Leukocyte elastase inhibitor [Bagarius yarrelli]
MENLSRANSAFALDLYRAISADRPGCKPVLFPAQHQRCTRSVPDVHNNFKSLNSAINSPKSSYILRLANKLYGEKTFSFLSPGTVTAMTRLALVNAIYFKGKWKHLFNTENTNEMPFKINQKETKPVQMMYQSKKFLFNYVDEYRLQVLDLPYEEEELSMVVLLPEETQDGSDPLHKLESELTIDKLLEWTNQEKMDRWTDINVHLPKFKLEENYSLKGILDKMGMSSLFQPGTADLTGISSKEGLFVSSVEHKAFVEVNEEGTEAAAATAVMIALCMAREENFMADHPFLFFIRHNPTKSILFFGRFSSP